MNLSIFRNLLGKQLSGELPQILWEFKKEFLVVGLISFVVNLLMLAPTFYMLQVYDRVFISHNELTLYALTAVVVFLFFIMSFSEWLRTRILVRVGIKFDDLLNRRVFKATYEEKLKASSVSAIETITDLNGVRTFMTSNGVFAFFDIPWMPVYIYVCYLLHPVLGLVAIFFAAILLLLTFFSEKFMKGLVEVSMLEKLKEQTMIAAKLRNPELVESMGMSKTLYGQWLKKHTKTLWLSDQSSKTTNYLMMVNKFFKQAQGSLVLAVGAWLVATDELRPSAMVAANLLVMRGIQPIELIVNTWEQFITAKVSYVRLTKLLKDNPVWSTKVLPLPPSGEVVCEHLYAYADPEQHKEPILKDINLKFKMGDVIAIMGHSGCGKSTLSRCILGIWPRTEGRVLLDGHDIKDYDREQLGSHIGYLPQDIELFVGTVAENIARFGELDNQKIIDAAQKAGIHSAILALPQGYDTFIGYAGGFLSGGQRQRLGLARALYGDPQIVLLDEPNANMDHEGEQYLFKAIMGLKASGKTVFVVAHTQSILNYVDVVLSMKDGQVEAYGPKDAVMNWSAGAIASNQENKS